MTDASGATGSSQATGGDASQQQQNGQQATDGQQQQAATQTNTQGQQQAQAGDTQQQTADREAALAQRFPGFSSWPAEAQEAVRARDRDAVKYQREAGDNRVAAREDARQAGANEATLALARSVFGALGVELPGEAQVTPEQLTQQVQATTGERDAARLESLTLRQAIPAGVDPTKLDYLAFKLSQNAEYRQIDPNDAAADGKVRASIDAVLAQDATLRQTGSVQTSGVASHVGNAGADTITPERFQKMTVQERTDLFYNDKPLYDRLVAAQS